MAVLSILDVYMIFTPAIIDATDGHRTSHALIFGWTAVSYDYGSHSLCRCFNKLMQCNKIFFPSSVALIFDQDVLIFSMGLRSGLVNV